MPCFSTKNKNRIRHKVDIKFNYREILISSLYYMLLFITIYLMFLSIKIYKNSNKSNIVN